LSTLEEAAIGSMAFAARQRQCPARLQHRQHQNKERLRRRQIPKGLKKEKTKDLAGMLQGESRPRRHRVALI
jgi:hypothetical protein